jgi:hypothetical protein
MPLVLGQLYAEDMDFFSLMQWGISKKGKGVYPDVVLLSV